MKPFYGLPSPWNPGYAIPDYVLAEPPARGAATTAWLPRGTIYPINPSEDVGMKLLGRGNAGLSGFTQPLGSLGGGSSLGDTATTTAAADAVASPAATTPSGGGPAPAPAPSSGPDAGTLLLWGGAGLVAYWLLKKKRRK